MAQLKAYLIRERSGFRNFKIRLILAVCLLWAGIAAFIGPSNFAAAEPSEMTLVDATIATSTPIVIAFMLSILALKIVAFVLGYLIVRLGHDTLIKGVTGEIDFGFSGSGFKTKLKAASPGALFVLMGAAIIIWGLMVKKPMEIKVLPPSGPPAIEAAAKSDETIHRAPVPD